MKKKISTPPEAPKTATNANPDSSDHIIETVKENLKNIRHNRKLSLDKLAIRCGVSRAMLSQKEEKECLLHRSMGD